PSQPAREQQQPLLFLVGSLSRGAVSQRGPSLAALPAPTAAPAGLSSCRTGEPFTFNATAAQPQHLLGVPRQEEAIWLLGFPDEVPKETSQPQEGPSGTRHSWQAEKAQQYFKYEFPEGVDSAIIKVTSSTAFPCSVISVQDILVSECPVYDLDNNVAFIGTYQTMTKKAAITVQKKDFPSHSFYVVVVVKTEDEACGGPLHYYPFSKDEPVDQGNRQKTLDVVVTPAVSCKQAPRLHIPLVEKEGEQLPACLPPPALELAPWRRKRRQRQLQFLSAVDTPCSDGGVRGRRGLGASGGAGLRPGVVLSFCPASARGGSCRPFAESRWGVARVPAEIQLESDSCRDQPSVAGAPVLNQPHGQLHNSWWVCTTGRKCGPGAATTQLLVVHVTGRNA
ncbi:hypothetical protein L345_17599, partial [Ophiophagus hannah]